MKLRNKKTDEVIDFDSITDACFGTKIQLQATDRHNKPIYIYNSLAELNAEWKDYEEPKEYWYIEPNGVIARIDEWECCTDSDIEIMKSLGNYFETKEDAEKAVENFKAFKRLQELGFRFDGIRFRDNHNYIEWKIEAKNELTDDEIGELLGNLYKVFGGNNESNK